MKQFLKDKLNMYIKFINYQENFLRKFRRWLERKAS